MDLAALLSHLVQQDLYKVGKALADPSDLEQNECKERACSERTTKKRGVKLRKRVFQFTHRQIWQDLCWAGVPKEKILSKAKLCLWSFWKGSKPKEQFTEDTLERTIQVKMTKPFSGVVNYLPSVLRVRFQQKVEMVCLGRNSLYGQVWWMREPELLCQFRGSLT